MQFTAPNICLALLVAIIFCACSPKMPKTLGERNTTYSYVPLDPLPVAEKRGRSCEDVANPLFKKLLDGLPDQAVRLAITQTDIAASGSFSTVAVGYEGHTYQVILDYITVDATQLPIYVKRVLSNGSNKQVGTFDESIKEKTRYIISAAQRYDEKKTAFTPDTTKGELVVIPIYIGVGLRLTASISVNKGKVNISSLGALSAAAEAGKITGTLTVQTLGVTGKNVSTALPLPSEINQTTIQNAILSIGSIKAILHDEANTELTARVVGFYNPIGVSPDITNGIISVLAQEPIVWYRPCDDPK